MWSARDEDPDFILFEQVSWKVIEFFFVVKWSMQNKNSMRIPNFQRLSNIIQIQTIIIKIWSVSFYITSRLYVPIERQSVVWHPTYCYLYSINLHNK